MWPEQAKNLRSTARFHDALLIEFLKTQVRPIFGPAADQIWAGHQSEDTQGARPCHLRHPAQAPGYLDASHQKRS